MNGWKEIGRTAWVRLKCNACRSTNCIVLPNIGELSCFECGARELVAVPHIVTLFWWLTHRISLHREHIARTLKWVALTASIAAGGVLVVGLLESSPKENETARSDANDRLPLSEQLAIALGGAHWPLAPAAQYAVEHGRFDSPDWMDVREPDSPGLWVALALPVDVQLCRHAKVASSCVRAADVYLWAARKVDWYGHPGGRQYWDEFRRFRDYACDAGDGQTCLDLARVTNDVRQLMIACDAGLGKGCYLAAVERAAGKAPCRCIDPDRDPGCREFPTLTAADERETNRLLERGCKLPGEYGCKTKARDIRHSYDLDELGKLTPARYRWRQKRCAKEEAAMRSRSIKES